MSWQRFQRGVRQIGGYSGGTSRLARPVQRLPEPDIRPGGRCPGLIGSTGAYRGTRGPHMLPDHSEIFFLDVDIYRYSFPGLSPIEQWTPDFSPIGSMCVSDAGVIYTCEVQFGKIYERSSATGAGSDSIITWTLPDTSTDSNLGGADWWTIAWNPGTQRIMAIRHISGFGPLVWSLDPTTQVAEVLPITLPTSTSSFTPELVCTSDGATWVGLDSEVTRINPAGDDYASAAVHYNQIAASHDNRCIVGTGDMELSFVDAALNFQVIDCPEIYEDQDSGFLILNHGTCDPSGEAFALMYLSGASNLVWQWPAP